MAPPAPPCPRPRPNPAGRRLTEFEQLLAVFGRWEGRFERLTCGPFEGTILAAGGRRARGYLATANQSILARGREAARLVAVVPVLLGSAGCVWQHRRLDPGHLVLRGSDVEVDHQTSRRVVRMELDVDEEAFRGAARVLVGIDPGRVSWSAVRPPPGAFDEFERRLRRFLHAAGREPSGAGETEVLEQACLRAAVEAVYPAARPAALPLPARTALVRRADELMRANFRVPVGEIDLCAALGVSGRTLRLAFRERYGLGPMAYYQAVRLNAARGLLRAAGPGGAPIGEVGRSCGFAHPGKFAGYYRRLFGESPSATRRGGPS